MTVLSLSMKLIVKQIQSVNWLFVMVTQGKLRENVFAWWVATMSIISIITFVFPGTENRKYKE